MHCHLALSLLLFPILVSCIRGLEWVKYYLLLPLVGAITNTCTRYVIYILVVLFVLLLMRFVVVVVCLLLFYFSCCCCFIK